MVTVTTHEAKTQLSRLIATVQSGEEVLICRGKQPAAKLTAVTPRAGRHGRRRPKVGEITAKDVHVARGAFAPLAGDELGDWGL